MFSSLTQFLPASLQQQNEERAKQNAQAVQEAEDEGEEEAVPEEEATSVKSKKKDRKANETFIFVRPPPSKTNHPLNLQVQLVPPHTRAPGLPPSTPRQSIDSSSTGGDALSRTTSATSASSDYSVSTSSFTSVSSTSSTRRAIVPLYNLQAHNVMTNTIVDAGTDAKIGKFQRKGLELIDLAILEPVEVWGPASGAAAGAPAADEAPNTPAGSRFSTRSNTTGGSLLIPANDRPTSPNLVASNPYASASDVSRASSNTSLTSSGHRPVSPAHLPQRRNSTKAKNIFGKFFSSKKSTVPMPATEAQDPDATISTTPTSSRFTRHLKTLSVSSTTTAGPPGSPMSINTPLKRRSFSPMPPDVVPEQEPAPNGLPKPEPPVVQPTLGLTPSLLLPRPAAASSSTQVNVANAKKGGRPILYSWLAKKWLKAPNEGGILGGLRGLGAGLAEFNSQPQVTLDPAQNPNYVGGDIDMRVEWRRDKKRAAKAKARRGGARKQTTDTSDARSIPEAESVIADDDKARRRLSTASGSTNFSGHGAQRSRSTESLRGLPASVRQQEQQEYDDGEESDPEDSETPWVCVLRITRRKPRPPRTSAESQRPGEVGAKKDKDGKERLKVRLATLSPTPHHPKVVAMLKVSWPLKAIDLLELIELDPNDPKRPRTPAHLIVTPEELKDIISCTGMWVVIREGFGGVGRERRRGDGWKIRG
ncbi:uncharacterized protein SCHCODRAFT_02639454 [Schizophyllum commune H4-8]|uniref:Uncharacterized protein n=1 Tax=Schizophyllum commune (strain H4-8 / FGSC 9210) TaxID=578458 RepID=D8QGC7_SCHCM|nr:uncharacterized protein SCHCODRAFT_02639454 [Schizophyllum commune H4-8]KAI5887995.1 hypothetical protein SCHCODRAFT_02639454 [Schizophyllum commune H4-8]